jgi:hypothetical protein
MTTLREAVAQALDALTKIHPANMSWETGDAWMNAVQILREALAQPEPEPAAWLLEAYDINEHKTLKRLVFERPNVNPGIRITPYYTHPPQRKPLTDEEIDQLSRTMVKGGKSVNWLCRAIEQAHGIGETT